LCSAFLLETRHGIGHRGGQCSRVNTQLRLALELQASGLPLLIAEPLSE